MISVPPFPEEAVLAAERKELAERLMVSFLRHGLPTIEQHEGLACAAVHLADALLAELAK